MKRRFDLSAFSSANEKILALLILLVGCHSLLLGIFVYFFTDLFYRLLFNSDIKNLFFVKQAGLFLFCLGLFYLSPLTDIARRAWLVRIIIFTKLLAVFFLISNAGISASPKIILLAAAGDGCMALLLVTFYGITRKAQVKSIPS